MFTQHAQSRVMARRARKAAEAEEGTNGRYGWRGERSSQLCELCMVGVAALLYSADITHRESERMEEKAGPG